MLPNPTRDPARKIKLANSYSELLDEFSSRELRHVGNYTLGKLIGKGSFGKVYLGTHKLTNGTRVVLKSAKKDDANLAREIHHHRQFTHPHIARLYEVIVTEDLVWLVLEYCAGDELYNHLLQHGRFEASKAQKIFAQLVGAVSYVHQRSCVHRDLKLENILLSKDEDVKLVDFGFTREYEGKNSYLQTWCGTVCYSAPEMLKGEKYAGEKVDVWSLGVILYALLTGELPFDEDDDEATKVKILREEVTYPDHIPELARDLLAKLLSKRPILRPGLSDILQHPWLAEYGPQQQSILKIQPPPPFTTDLEKETLQRMRSAGVNIDTVIENVLAQRCDSLAGWWALLIEKEERKAKRREKKRRDRDADNRSIRRLSAASSRLERLAAVIHESDDEPGQSFLQVNGETSRGRPRSAQRRKSEGKLPVLVEMASVATQPSQPAEAVTTATTTQAAPTSNISQVKPAPPPKEARDLTHQRSQSQALSIPPPIIKIPPSKQRPHQMILGPLASLKRWLKIPTGRSKDLLGVRQTDAPSPTRRPIQNLRANTARRASMASNTSYRYSNSHLSPPPKAQQHSNHVLSRSPGPAVLGGNPNARRPSLSPLHSQHGSQRRISAGLRGRKSTSSSLSSIRSAHPHPSHTRASSTSSTNASIASPTVASHNRLGRSPHSSVKVLPGTPTTMTFPSNIRVVRAGPGGAGHSEAGAVFGSLPSPSPGLIFARRKRSPFKGPMLSLDMHERAGRSSRAKSGSRSGSVQGRPSEDAIREEDEDEEEAFETMDDMSPSTELTGFLDEEDEDGEVGGHALGQRGRGYIVDSPSSPVVEGGAEDSPRTVKGMTID